MKLLYGAMILGGVALIGRAVTTVGDVWVPFALGLLLLASGWSLFHAGAESEEA